MGKVFIGDALVGIGPIDGAGAITIPVHVPFDTQAGTRLVTVGVLGTALTADCVVNVGQGGPLLLTPEIASNVPGTQHTVTATARTAQGAPRPGVTVTFVVGSGPNAGATGTCAPSAACITGVDGTVSFTYSSNGNPGADQVAASFVDGATTVPSNPAVKLWDGDCNHNHIADTCDTSCTGFGGACAKVVMCAMRTDFDSDGVPDECKCTYAGSTAARVSNDSTSSANLLANAPGGLAKLARNVVFTDGTTVTGSEVRLANGANAFDVHGDARLARRATVRHATGPATLPLVDPFCPVTPITCGGADLDVPTGGHADLAAGDHGAVTLRNDASLTLAAGTHTFCSLRTGRRAKIDVAAGVQTVLDVAGDLRLQNGTRFRAAASAPPPIVNVAGAEIRIGPQSEVEARIAGGAAAASVGREARVAGGLCAATFRTGRKVKLACSLP